MTENNINILDFQFKIANKKNTINDLNHYICLNFIAKYLEISFLEEEIFSQFYKRS